MSTGNRFLDEFIERQGRIVSVPSSGGKKKPKKGLPQGDGEFSAKEELNKLIQEKPPKKEVLEYFKQRIEQLVQEDMKRE
jgi:hypothetical protein